MWNFVCFSNGSALEDWAEDQDTMEEVMRVPIRAVYDYFGQEEDELTFKSGKAARSWCFSLMIRKNINGTQEFNLIFFFFLI